MKTICVYCGSNKGRDPQFARGAAELAKEIVSRGITLVYGGGKIGLMGLLADQVLALGGKAVGVIPKNLVEREIGHAGLTQLHVVENMHERKLLMANLSDAFVALPGGIGTMDELFEIFTWAQIGLHQKPCGLLNIAAYYDRLLEFLDHMVEAGFLRIEHRQMLISSRDINDLLDRLPESKSTIINKWV